LREPFVDFASLGTELLVFANRCVEGLAVFLGGHNMNLYMMYKFMSNPHAALDTGTVCSRVRALAATWRAMRSASRPTPWIIVEENA